jgi:DNA-directed RNA polymerase specialized sigma subunit
MDNDKEQLVTWQKTHDPELLMGMMIRYRPVINSVVNKYKTTGIPPASLRAVATTEMLKSFNTYDINKNVEPITHLYNNLLKIQRIANSSLLSGHVPEARAMKRVEFNTVKLNLTDSLGYTPNNSQMADEMGWSSKEVERMESESKGEVGASGAKFDFWGNSTVSESKDKVLVDYLYHELPQKQKSIFEYTFGYNGKPILNNKQIALKMRTNEMDIHRQKKLMSARIKEMR